MTESVARASPQTAAADKLTSKPGTIQLAKLLNERDSNSVRVGSEEIATVYFLALAADY